MCACVRARMQWTCMSGLASRCPHVSWVLLSPSLPPGAPRDCKALRPAPSSLATLTMALGKGRARLEALMTVAPEAARGVDAAAVGTDAGLGAAFIFIWGGKKKQANGGDRAPSGPVASNTRPPRGSCTLSTAYQYSPPWSQAGAACPEGRCTRRCPRGSCTACHGRGSPVTRLHTRPHLRMTRDWCQ